MKNSITPRAIIISLLILPIHAYVMLITEIVLYSSSPTCFSIFYTSVFILFLSTIINLGLKKFFPKHALSQGELITIYIASNISIIFVGHDFLQSLINTTAYPLRFATAENNWYNLMINKIPDWIVIKDKDAVDAYYVGGDTFFQWRYIKAWIKPIAIWSCFILVLMYVMMCINTIIRKQWNENEKLAYPLINLPLEMTKDKTPLLQNKLFYTGIGIAVVFSCLQGLSTIFPTFPVLSIKEIYLHNYFVDPPWNSMGFTPIRFYPIVIGISYLIPTDLSFSIWFFFIFSRLQNIFGAATGINTIPRFPFLYEQSAGALWGIFAFAVFYGRKHLIEVIKKAFGKSDLDDSTEVISYRTAFWGMLIGMALMMCFNRVLGVSVWVAVLLVIGYFVACTSLTRTRAELGNPAHDIFSYNIISIMMSNLGTANLGNNNIIGMYLNYWYNRSYRSNMMPFQLESITMNEKIGITPKSTGKLIALMTIAGLIVGLVIMLGIYYKLGASTSMNPVTNIFGIEVFGGMEGSLKSGTIADVNGIIALITGFVGYCVLAIAKVKIPGFPLNPVAYAMMGSWSLMWIWSGAMLSWAVKVIILRFGGMKVFLNALPFFLGLILGDCIVGTIWCIVSLILKMPTYSIFP